jgi:hypothetical protein
LQPTTPHLTPSSPYRCLQHHRISQLPGVEGNKPSKSKFKTCAIGFFHVRAVPYEADNGIQCTTPVLVVLQCQRSRRLWPAGRLPLSLASRWRTE